ncbi:MAG: elongation factor G [Verrucomicrobiota bacterium]
MSDIPVSDVRTFGLMGHTSSGKTTLADALLYKLGVNSRMGLVDSGSSMADYTDEEKDRKITISAKPFAATHKAGGKETRLVFIDTPGYMDFFGEVLCACRACETGLIAIDAASGIQVGTHKVWKACEQNGLARSIVITGLDKDNTDFSKILSDIQSTFGDCCVPVTLPLPDGSGVVDVLGDGEAPDAVKDQVEEARSGLTEKAAETNDELIEKFLGGETLSADEVANGLRKAVVDGGLVPVFVCMPLKDLGIEELMTGAQRFFPSPADREITDAEGNAVNVDPEGGLVAQVWRSVNDPFVGKLSFVRVFGGKLQKDAEIMNASLSHKEKAGSLLVVNGKEQDSVDSAMPGEIVAIPKLKDTGFGDTLCGGGSERTMPEIELPSPVYFMAVFAKTQADEDKLGTALARVTEEDPTLNFRRDSETHETVLSGLGDVHIDVAVSLMKRRSNVEVNLKTPRVPYHETVTAQGDGHHKHKKQSGGRGQYGEVYLKVEPKQPEDEDWFVDAIVGGVIPGGFMPAVQKGLVEGMKSGAVAGYPVTDVKITVYDGSYHDVDSSEVAFKIAASKAFREAMSKAKPVLLEPIMTVKVTITDQHLGDVNGDLNQRRGRILGMSPEEGMQVITADVPQAELFKYCAELRSMTAGQGSFEMEFSRYEQVPSNVAQKVIAEAQKEED